MPLSRRQVQLDGRGTRGPSAASPGPLQAPTRCGEPGGQKDRRGRKEKLRPFPVGRRIAGADGKEDLRRDGPDSGDRRFSYRLLATGATPRERRGGKDENGGR